jgi:multidrug efflux pump subunit AcrB
MTTLLTGALCVFGLMAYRILPVSDLPNIDFPTIVVNASLPGATPETMASAVATVLEQQLSTIAGIDSMTSTSSLGNTAITIQFNLSRSIDAAAQDVQASIAAVQRRLPADMPAPPSLRKTNPADSPILWLSLSSPTLPLSVVDEYAQNHSPSASRPSTAWRWCKSTEHKNTLCGSSSTRAPSPAAASRSTRCVPLCPPTTSTCRRACWTGISRR